MAITSADIANPQDSYGFRREKRKSGLPKARVRRACAVDSRSDAKIAVTLTDLIQFLDGIAIESLAEERGISARAVVAALPKSARRFASPTRFVEVMDDIAAWGPVTIPLRTAHGIVEFTGELPKGEFRHGHFYWLGEGKLRGHLRLDRCGDIAFVEHTFMGRPSASVVFFSRDGGVMFKVFLARDGTNGPAAAQLNAFRSLARRVSGRSVPTRRGHRQVRATRGIVRGKNDE